MTKDEFLRLSGIEPEEIMLDILENEGGSARAFVTIFEEFVREYAKDCDGKEEGALLGIMYLGYKIGKGAIKDEDGV